MLIEPPSFGTPPTTHTPTHPTPPPPTRPPSTPKADPAAEPNPDVNPATGLPKNPFTVVFASPTLISRQSAFPVIGSTYCCRRNRILFVFSSCSIEPG